MPYAGGTYTVPPGTAATTLTPIDSSDYNAFVADIEAAQNAARPVGAGGTGLQSYTTGDLLYASSSSVLSKLAKGVAGQVLRLNAGATLPVWGSVSPRGYGNGCTLSNNGSDATNDIDIATGL